MAAPRKASGKKKFTPKQRKFIAQFPAIATGGITVEAAMKKSGYAPASARQQMNVMKGLRHSTAMQSALLNAGVTEPLLAGKIRKGLSSYDKDTVHKFVTLSAKLLDAFPAERHINADVEIEDLIKAQEANAADE